MKSLILSCLLAVGLLASAQNYRLIPSGVNCYINDTGYIRGIRLDSGVVAGGDTIYNNFFEQISDTNCPLSNCSIYQFPGLGVNKFSWTAKHYTIQSQGVQFILDSLNDTIFFQTLAPLNTTWRVFSFSNGNYLEAQIASIDTEMVLGIVDSVKYMQLVRKNAQGQAVLGAFNNMVLKLSQNHGLLTFLDFKNMPNDTAIYNITDIHPLTGSQVYDFSIGDIIQIKEFRCWYNPGPRCDSFYTTEKCIAKNNSVQFQFARTQCNMTDFSCITDSITVNNYYGNGPVLAGMPEEGTGSYVYKFFSSHNKYGGRPYMAYDDLYLQSMGLCYYPQCAENLIPNSRMYVLGLGDIYTYAEMPGLLSRQDFTYYKKGTEEWGTFFTGINAVPPNPFNVFLSPNPADSKATFHFNAIKGSTVSIHISDITGRDLLSQEFPTSNNITINTTSLTNGLYLYYIKNGDNYATGKLVIAR